MKDYSTMTKKEIFVDYVKNGNRGRCICSPQIGAGAGFDTKLAGKEWISDTTFEDTLNAALRFDMVPLFNVGMIGFDSNEKLRWTYTNLDKTEAKRYYNRELETPFGKMMVDTVEEKGSGGFNVKDAIEGEEDMDKLEWYVDQALETDFSQAKEVFGSIAGQIAQRGALSVQWAMQPYEMLCLPNTINTMFLAMDCEEQFYKIMDKILLLDMKMIDSLVGTGVDFLFLGGPAKEMISPRYFEDFLVPYSKKVTDYAHEKGFLIYSHVCSPVEPMLGMGYYNQMGIDLFETLSMPPVGNVVSLEDAFSKIDPQICTRGNLGLDVLLNSTPDEIKRKCYEIMEVTMKHNRKHILAASDYLFAQTPVENITAMCDAVKEFYK